MAPVRALAVAVSNRAAAGVYEDRSGPVLAELLRAAGCAVDGPVVVPDGEPVAAALRDAVTSGYDVVVTTGGTGLTPLDLTPEMTRRVVDREIPGIAEALRAAGAAAGVPAAILSRGVAGVAGRTLVVNLPGSTGGVRDGMAVLAPVLEHAVSQIHGGDHVRADSGAQQLRGSRVALEPRQGNDGTVGRMRGWPVTLTEPHLLGEPVGLRPVRVSDARTWREIRVRNAPWLRPWEPTNPETPLYRSSLGPYIAMVRAMRREARQGQAVPWVVTFGGEFVGQLTVGSITWGSARSGQVGYWIDEAYAGRGIIPTVLAMAVDHCFGVIGLHRLEASIRPENHASRRVVEKLGFREEGIRVRQLHINGAWRDHVCYALTAEEVPQGLMPRWRSMVLASRSGTA
jgi:[ribosomal protein S5]-alanine N-acetyltransferase